MAMSATIRAMFRRESLYAPRIFAQPYLILATTEDSLAMAYLFVA